MIKAAQKQLKLHPCDIILASSYRTFPLYAAYQLSQKYALPLIVDLRDIIEQYTNQEFFAHYKNRIPLIGNLIARLFKNKLLSQRNKILQKADYVTTISEWHVDTLKAYNAKTHLIYNGFDADLFTPAIQKSKQFLICYTGRILSTAMRNPALLFEAVKQLHNEHRIDTKEFRIQFFTNAESKSILTHAAADYQLEDFIEYHDMVAYTEIPAILNNSSILLLLTNKADANGPKGIMTTKFFEYLAVEKPILCITGDEGCLETALNEAQAGLAAHHVDEVKRFIIDQYTTWKNNGYTHIEPNKEALQKYDRKYQAKQFVELFNALCP